ncbi:alpha/beta family hydrolase [Kordiimonas aquimaris]|uniref:alpha/beta family hydrolase n=1 Tax=Kordiimonas aquimaris TaxID=707591 RepID=UPI0021D2C786|nr:alpha/beta family hydrolase [Kordiimonas aquimaris]
MNFLRQGKPDIATLLLAHGAGAPMDSPFMNDIVERLSSVGFEVVRFEFPYMTERRVSGKKRPPDRAPILLEAFENTISALNTPKKLIIGGKSMGGRMASMIAANGNAHIDGVLCLGYPFHPPGRPEKLRTDHLPSITLPTLIVQGERDPFGGNALVKTLSLPKNISVSIAPDGNHDLAPRKRSGRSHTENLQLATETIVSFFGNGKI